MTEEDLALLAHLYLEADELPDWTPAPITVATKHHTICADCDGKKLCQGCGGPGNGHPYCDGYCAVCGGAGQIPIHPEVPLVRPPANINPYPRPVQINRDYLAKQALKQLRKMK